jgi:hypothetical protein
MRMPGSTEGMSPLLALVAHDEKTVGTDKP